MPLAKESNKKFTSADYLTWPSDERWELIDGKAYDMTPAPSVRHQKIVNNLNIFLSTHPKKKKECFIGIAPTDILLSENDVVQPDIFTLKGIEIPFGEIFEAESKEKQAQKNKNCKELKSLDVRRCYDKVINLKG